MSTVSGAEWESFGDRLRVSPAEVAADMTHILDKHAGDLGSIQRE